jgi:hypothetical protein
VDPVSLILGAAILGGGYLVGLLTGRRQRKPAPYTCGCTHAFAMHDPKTGECHVEIKTQLYNKHNNKAGFEYVECPCRHYVGERPLDLDVINEQAKLTYFNQNTRIALDAPEPPNAQHP